jgi:dTDP-4-dehydrorhamnose 3,5-epimerase-like enzyme
MFNVRMIKFKKISDNYGSLVPVEADADVPFNIKRVYYIFGVEKEVRRGFHSHSRLHQVLICLNGSIKILLKTPDEQKIIELNDESEGLYIGPMIWREMYDFSEGSTLLVLANEHYDEKEYIRKYDNYVQEYKNYSIID